MQEQHDHPASDSSKDDPYAPPRSEPDPDPDPEPPDKPTFSLVQGVAILFAIHLIVIVVLFVITRLRGGG